MYRRSYHSLSRQHCTCVQCVKLVTFILYDIVLFVCQGISVPEKRQLVTEDGKKKVMYGARQRKQKKKQEDGDETSPAQSSMATGQDDSMSEQAPDEVGST